MSETLIGLLKEGHPVRTGVAIFTPVIDAQGNLSVSVRVDKRITTALNAPGAFTSKISNSANIGMTREEVAALWNREHPDNPVGSGTGAVPAASPADQIYRDSPYRAEPANS